MGTSADTRRDVPETGRGTAANPGAQSVPRYTSYPTAPNFTPAVNAETHARWLAELPAQTGLSIYLHVPFCVELCHYCGCNTHATRRRDPVDRYIEDLAAEIALVSRITPARKVRRIHWGGGTPSIAGAAGLRRVFKALENAFDLSEVSEHAIEIDPRRLDKEVLKTLAAIGINRANLGVQEFSLETQKAIGRVQPFELVEAAVTAIREAGIENIGADLMYGLPKQTVEDVRFSATLMARLKPQRVAIFGYAHVPWFKKQQSLIDVNTLPAAEERYVQAMAARDAWIKFGYVPIGVDHYALQGDALAAAAKKGSLHRNFQGYTDDDCPVLIGLGATAISRFPGGYAQNHPATAAYAAQIRAGRLSTVRGISLTEDDILRAELIERLMCEFRVDIDDLVSKYRLPTIFSRELAMVDQLATQGMVRRTGRRIEVTQKGQPFVRVVASVFDRYLAEKATRHSMAV